MAVEKNLLKSTLNSEGRTQEELAKAAGVSVRTVGKSCNHVRVSAKTKRKIVAGLNEIAANGPYTVNMIYPKGLGSLT